MHNQTAVLYYALTMFNKMGWRIPILTLPCLVHQQKEHEDEQFCSQRKEMMHAANGPMDGEQSSCH